VLTDANPQHIRLKPLKSNGAVSDRNKADWKRRWALVVLLKPRGVWRH